MGILDALPRVVEAPLKVASGVINGVKDTASLVDNALDGDWNEVAQDGLKLVGDANDVAEGLTTLGASVSPLPTAFVGMKNLLPADSKILWAAQMVINGMKLTTGSGDPTNGDEFRESADRLDWAVTTLIEAAPHDDRWDGTAAQVYNAVNASHRRVTSEMQVADLGVAKILDTEADQVSRTRDTLDDQIAWLKAYDLATVWMNATPPSAEIKVGLDIAASAAALAIAGPTLAVLVKNSMENAWRITQHLDGYENAAKDTSGKPMGGCEVFPVPEQGDPEKPEETLPRHDQHASPLPSDPHGPIVPPKRSLPDEKYTVPSPEEPIEHGPPAIPYSVPASGPSSTPSTPPRPPAAGAPAVPPPAPAPATASKLTSAAAPRTTSGGRAPVDAGSRNNAAPGVTSAQP